MNAAEMRKAIWQHYASRCAVLFEISTDAQRETAPRRNGDPASLLRRRQIDVLTVSRARKQGIGPLDLMAIEIKVSRSDFFADVREPLKQARWREIAHRHAFAVPEGLVRPEEVPAGSGLLTVGKYVGWTVRAPYSESPGLPAWLTLSLAYRLSTAEAKIRGLTGVSRDFANDSPEDLRAALVKAREQVQLLNGQLDRARTENKEWKTAFAAQGHLPCGHCGKPVRPRSVRRGYFTDWVHVNSADEPACAEIRAGFGGRWIQIGPADDIPVPQVAS